MSNKSNGQVLKLTVKDIDLEFDIGRDDYNKYVNSVTQNSKVAPSHNFLMTTVNEKQRAELREFLKNTPGAEVQLAGALLEEYTPDLGIVVKKSSSALSE
ncbi:putative phage tail assembly chaperone [Cellvibrio sp. QJXJ]|uniref:putative phage tail assembly chaperone n=1 Tax=Cellvibrio sp. QJXJ TaxID=2964606 RepID=UPI0021C294C1|nr:putative phage tail assembly chaperone [Cellvibrio sp. QJXJ]UUA73101.1 putative phage tail assembly chaperone [Cellvibrio sp. QJXJ]